jgi:hypothetical protein
MLKLLESLIFIILWILSTKFGGNLSKFARAALPHLDTARHLSITLLYFKCLPFVFSLAFIVSKSSYFLFNGSIIFLGTCLGYLINN